MISDLDRKRSGPPLAVPILTKKPKRPVGSSYKSFAWEKMCIDVDPIDLIVSIDCALQDDEHHKAVSLYILSLYSQRIAGPYDHFF